MRVYVEGIGLHGPGLRGWRDSVPVLAGVQPYQPARTVIPPSELLPPAERRRAGIPIRLALAAGAEALAAAGRDATTLPTVFTSSESDGQILHEICDTLTKPGREVSPTRFMNSVHNAASGYWSIATRSREASTSLCCYDASFAAGLLECAVQVLAEGRPAALVAYDAPYPEPLHAARPIEGEFGLALVLSADAARAMFALELELGGAAETRLPDAGLEKLRLNNPAARSLPLLAAMARGSANEPVLAYTPAASLMAKVSPC